MLFSNMFINVYGIFRQMNTCYTYFHFFLIGLYLIYIFTVSTPKTLKRLDDTIYLLFAFEILYDIVGHLFGL
jgi:hypothetical protein